MPIFEQICIYVGTFLNDTIQVIPIRIFVLSVQNSAIWINENLFDTLYENNSNIAQHYHKLIYQ